MIAIASTTFPSTSVIEPSVIREAIVCPRLSTVAMSSFIATSVSFELTFGASFTAFTVIFTLDSFVNI